MKYSFKTTSLAVKTSVHFVYDSTPDIVCLFVVAVSADPQQYISREQQYNHFPRSHRYHVPPHEHCQGQPIRRGRILVEGGGTTPPPPGQTLIHCPWTIQLQFFDLASTGLFFIGRLFDLRLYWLVDLKPFWFVEF